MQIMNKPPPVWPKYAIMCHVIVLPSKPGSTKAMHTGYFKKLNLMGNKCTLCCIYGFDMVEIKGERGRKVPDLLSVEVKDALIQTRSKVGVHPDNTYIFARVNRDSRKFIGGWDCLKPVITRAKVKSPELITSTKLRKYIATVCQIIDMTNSELDWLAKHLGHDITVHRGFYGLQESTLELAKLNKLLIAVDEGKATQLAGKTLNEVDFSGKNQCTLLPYFPH